MNKDITKIQSDTESIRGVFIQSFFAGSVSIVLSFILLLIIAAYLYINPISVERITIFSYSAKYVCAAVAAAIACINRKTKGYLRGLLSSLCFVLLGGLLFGLISPNGFSSRVFLYDLIICSVLGILTGAVTVNFNSRKRK